MKNNDVSTISNPRRIAVQILTRIERTDAYLDKLLDNEFRSGNLNDKDKRLLNEITNGVIRHKNRIDWVIQNFYKGDFLKINYIIKNTLRVALYQILFLTKIPGYAVVNESVEIIKNLLNDNYSRLVNAVLRNILRQFDNIKFPTPEGDEIKYLSIYHSHPEWMIKRWLIRFGYTGTEELLIANNQHRDLSFRINGLKTNRDRVEIELLSRKIKFERSKYLDDFLHIKNVGNLDTFDLHKRGDIYIQDDSAGLAVKLLDPQKNERIIDLCAAPGGKLAYIADKMKNTGELVAIDLFEVRLKMLRENCLRLGITNVESFVQDARAVELEPADRILIDAPCSGLGTLSKKPDIKWKQNIDHIIKLTHLQYEILCNASRLIKEGGVLVYSTCTIEPEEDYYIIKKFLTNHSNFVLEDARNFVSTEIVNEDGCIETLPHKHLIDGSFAARMKRIS